MAVSYNRFLSESSSATPTGRAWTVASRPGRLNPTITTSIKGKTEIGVLAHAGATIRWAPDKRDGVRIGNQ